MSLPALPAWIWCHCGQDVWCIIHRQHVMDCPCPDYEYWAPLDPFAPMFAWEPRS